MAPLARHRRAALITSAEACVYILCHAALITSAEAFLLTSRTTYFKLHYRPATTYFKLHYRPATTYFKPHYRPASTYFKLYYRPATTYFNLHYRRGRAAPGTSDLLKLHYRRRGGAPGTSPRGCTYFNLLLTSSYTTGGGELRLEHRLEDVTYFKLLQATAGESCAWNIASRMSAPFGT